MKRPAKKQRRVSKPKVKKVALSPISVLEVVVPKGIVPAVVPEPSKGIVTIVPVPAAKSKTWWQRTFG